MAITPISNTGPGTLPMVPKPGSDARLIRAVVESRAAEVVGEVVDHSIERMAEQRERREIEDQARREEEDRARIEADRRRAERASDRRQRQLVQEMIARDEARAARLRAMGRLDRLA